MQELLKQIEGLKNSSIKKTIDQRISEFRELGSRSSSELFKEMSFCILTANFSAKGGIRIQQAIGEGFITLPPEALEKKLKELGHRFPAARAAYICLAREHADKLREIIFSRSEHEARVWVADNIKGLGYKEASHFLRNIGLFDLAIIDFHIIDLLVRRRLIERPKTITRKKYLEIESVLRDIGKQSGLTLAELDLYLWYLETGTVLK